jgi:hypothetical protein
MSEPQVVRLYRTFNTGNEAFRAESARVATERAARPGAEEVRS